MSYSIFSKRHRQKTPKTTDQTTRWENVIINVKSSKVDRVWFQMDNGPKYKTGDRHRQRNGLGTGRSPCSRTKVMRTVLYIGEGGGLY